MKKYLLTPILTTLFSVPAFSAFPGADMNNTNIEGKTTSSNMQIQYNDKQNKKHSGNDKNATTDLNSEKVPLQHRQARDAQETNADRHESNHRPQPQNIIKSLNTINKYLLTIIKKMQMMKMII